jgi:hypothetical protein
MPQQLTLKTANVVALGRFDVRSFTPTALLGSEVLTLPEATAVESLTVIPGRAVSFETSGLKVTAEQHRIQIERLAPPYIKAADVLSKAIRDNAKFPSDITAVGINTNATWLLDDLDVRNKLGRQLAPIDAWGRWSEELRRAAEVGARDPRNPGLASITMRLPMTEDRKAGWIDVRVGPTFRVAGGPEIIIAINDHYAFDDADKEPEPLALLATVETRFDASIKRADEIAASILEQAK